jgi:hypothetical protein
MEWICIPNGVNFQKKNFSRAVRDLVMDARTTTEYIWNEKDDHPQTIHRKS